MNERDESPHLPRPTPTAAPRLATARRALVGAALATVLLWRGGDALVRGGVEIARKAGPARRALVLSQEERIRQALEHFETEYGFEPGELGRIYDVFDTEVEFPDEVLVVLGRFDRRRAGIVRIAYHLYPVRLANVAALPADGPPDPERIDAGTWILEVDPGPPDLLRPWFVEVARGPSFALWRGKKARR